MKVIIKTPEQISKIRIASQLAADVLSMITKYIVPGRTTNELNEICHEYIVKHQDAIPAPLNYNGFPKSICTSVNHVVCHGIPDDTPLQDGDIINIDITVQKNGYYGDTSKTFLVGNVAPAIKQLIHAAQLCLYAGIKKVYPDGFMGDIGHAIQACAEQYNYSVVKEYCGHGIGSSFHEAPHVLHFGYPGTGLILKPGMVFTIEPAINMGTRHIVSDPETGMAFTKDGLPSVQWEHTIAVTDDGYEILTYREGEESIIEKLHNPLGQLL